MNNARSRKYVFGPVPSRRLGRSLGVDLVPFKYCPFDCVYCQLGGTTCKTIERSEFVPLSDVVAEIGQRLAECARPDYITMSGSGEPTLYSRLGELIAEVRSITDVPVAVLTNAALIWDESVRNDLAQAQLVVPSLDAGDEKTFQRVNRPHPDLVFDRIVEGLVTFSHEFDGDLRLEVFVLANTRLEDIERIARITRRIRCDTIQLNTVERPPSEPDAAAAARDRMEQFAAVLGPKAEIIAEFSADDLAQGFSVSVDDVLAMLKRRPCSQGDVASGLGIHRNDAAKFLGHLLRRGDIEQDNRGGVTYYKPSRTAP